MARNINKWTTIVKIYMGGIVKKAITIYLLLQHILRLELTPHKSIRRAYVIYKSGRLEGVGTYFIDDVTVKEVTRDNVPRIDYTGGGCPHILAEPQRTNLVTYSSNDFTDSSWN